MITYTYSVTKQDKKIQFYGRIRLEDNTMDFFMSSCLCCPITQDPCNGLVVNIFPPIVLVAISGLFTRIILKHLPDTKDSVPGWLQFILRLLVQLIIGFCIQYFGCIRNMWKTPSCKGLLMCLFFMIFVPLLLPVVLKVL